MSKGDEDRTAQERLQRNALRNVRALLDKLERGTNPLAEIAVAFSLVFVILAIAVTYAVATRKPSEPAPPLKATSAMTVAEYQDYVRQRIQGKANTMTSALRQIRPGEAEVVIRLRPNGYGDLTFVRSSGDSQMDDRMGALVKFSEPFGAPPAGAESVGIGAVLRVARRDGDMRLVVEAPRAPQRG